MLQRKGNDAADDGHGSVAFESRWRSHCHLTRRSGTEYLPAIYGEAWELNTTPVISGHIYEPSVAPAIYGEV